MHKNYESILMMLPTTESKWSWFTFEDSERGECPQAMSYLNEARIKPVVKIPGNDLLYNSTVEDW